MHNLQYTIVILSVEKTTAMSLGVPRIEKCTNTLPPPSLSLATNDALGRCCGLKPNEMI